MILACGAAIGVVPWAPGWWRPLAIAGGAIGVAAFLSFYDGQIKLVVQEGGIGLLASLAPMLVALALPGAFGS
jgi:hypothetical protein